MTNIVNEIVITDEKKQEKHQLQNIMFNQKKRRYNNRKTARGRKTQIIHCLNDKVWPPVYYTKVIKHV